MSESNEFYIEQIKKAYKTILQNTTKTIIGDCKPGNAKIQKGAPIRVNKDWAYVERRDKEIEKSEISDYLSLVCNHKNYNPWKLLAATTGVQTYLKARFA